MTDGTNPELCAALVAAQAEMPAVEPNATNPHFKSKFVSLDHLIARTRPVLNRHGLAIIQAPAHLDGAPALATTVLHTSGQSVTSMVPLILGKQDMQGLGAAITYARRYAWASALGIASEEDDDGEQSVSRQRDEPAEEPAVKGGARGWDHLWELLGECGIPREDAEVWVRQAAKEAHGLESLKDATADERRLVFRQANDALIGLAARGDMAFSADAREEIRYEFAQAFGGVWLEGPPWRLGPNEPDRPTRVDWDSAQVG